MKSPHSKFDQYSSLRYKATTARDIGAIGIIFVNTKDNKEDALVEFKYDNAAKITGISAVSVTRENLSFIPLLELQNQIDSTLTLIKEKLYVEKENLRLLKRKLKQL